MNDKINVLVLNVSLVEGMAGSMRVKNILEPLYENNDITLSNLALTHTYEKDKIGTGGLTENNIPYLYIGYNSPLNFREVSAFYNQGVLFLKEQFKPGSENYIYNYGYPDVKNLYLIIAAKRIGYKVLFDIVEDNRFAKRFSGFLGWLRMKSSIFLIQKIRFLGDAVIVISSHLEKRMKEICRGQIPIINIPITVNLKYFPEKPWDINPEEVKIFYGGSFFLGKDGMEYLIDAFKQVAEKYPKISLLLSGKSVVKEEMDKVLNMISDFPQIQYLGYLTSDEYFKVLNDCDVFCMPRNNSLLAHAGFPFKLGEFLATGKAIIATNVGDVPVYLEHLENAYLINPESAEEIEEALSYLITHKSEMIRLGRQARKTAETVFSSDILSNRFYENLLKV